VLVSSVRRKTLERSACERLGLAESLDRAAESSEPDESWLDGLNEAFAGLPEGQRDAIRLRVVEELPYREVAVLLGTSTQAARVRVHRGLADLRSRFGNRSEERR
jgi:RNA polymerase sigma-70 factor (ECF subfamily)